MIAGVGRYILHIRVPIQNSAPQGFRLVKTEGQELWRTEVCLSTDRSLHSIASLLPDDYINSCLHPSRWHDVEDGKLENIKNKATEVSELICLKTFCNVISLPLATKMKRRQMVCREFMALWWRSELDWTGWPQWSSGFCWNQRLFTTWNKHKF